MMKPPSLAPPTAPLPPARASHPTTAGGWFPPPPIFGPHVIARATADLAPPRGPFQFGRRSQSPKRIGEFVAGRRCAARALRDAGSPSLTVGVGPDREPQWPSGFTGSITHSPSRACAAVAPLRCLRSLGVDFEPLFDEAAMSDAILARGITLTDRERTRMGSSPPVELATLVFSAKECLYKCLYPLVRVFFEFTDAEVEWIAPSGEFQVRLLRDLGSGFMRNSEFQGRYAVAEGHVHTALELPT
jgi:enterobactin synthetase component D